MKKTTCSRCGIQDEGVKIHFIDEDSTNLLPSDQEPLCFSCYKVLYSAGVKQPFITVAKTMRFASAHRLPFYQGKCNNLHGHEWKIQVKVRRRIDPETGMVVDFSKLKKIISQYIIEPLDHSLLNNHLQNPTAENLLIWAWGRLAIDAELKGIESISIWESEDSVATLDSKDMLDVLSDGLEKERENGIWFN